MNQYTDAIGFFGTFIFFLIAMILLYRSKYWPDYSNALTSTCYFSITYPLITGILYLFLPRKITGEVTLVRYLAPFYLTVMMSCLYGLCLIVLQKIGMYLESRNKQ